MMPLTPEELRIEQHRVRRQAVRALFFCATVLVLARWYLPLVWTFPDGLAERIAFALQAAVFVLLWVVIGVRLVASGRYRFAEDNRGSAYGPPSPALAIKVAFLQNTLEQAVMAIGAYLALATLAPRDDLSLIVGGVILFAIGRATFLRGYPHGAGGRAFGVAVTALPMVAAYGYAIVLMALNLLN